MADRAGSRARRDGAVSWSSPHAPHLEQLERGRFACRSGGHEFVALLIGQQWVVHVDGIERFSAARLQVAEEKIAEWLAGER